MLTPFLSNHTFEVLDRAQDFIARPRLSVIHLHRLCCTGQKAFSIYLASSGSVRGAQSCH